MKRIHRIFLILFVSGLTILSHGTNGGMDRGLIATGGLLLLSAGMVGFIMDWPQEQ